MVRGLLWASLLVLASCATAPLAPARLQAVAAEAISIRLRVLDSASIVRAPCESAPASYVVTIEECGSAALVAVNLEERCLAQTREVAPTEGIVRVHGGGPVLTLDKTTGRFSHEPWRCPKGAARTLSTVRSENLRK